ncbi:aspartate/methionine/tyrosine aminotransferase [Mumia flava]|uniref:Aminotransferase n=1 Tax=Mumia flava TaxID=1348852 RepID=A0A0B2B2G9_9ACTN|nr:aminotransferase [Mumia flava]PJJ54115.1 aspartate/methionine/tyrosine aminotransferase [Mumia flava]
MRLRSQTTAQVDSPISTAYALLDQSARDGDLLDLAQAAPQYPPSPVVSEHVADLVRAGAGSEYTEVPGLPRLRDAVASELSTAYAGRVAAENVVITAGCNQAFAMVASALAGAGDEVVLALPYYFNHDMWLRMNGVAPVYLEPDADLVPRAADAEPLITVRTRAIVIVTPGNPTGVTMPPAEIAAFAELADRHGIALVVDETYRSFRDCDQPAHDLFADPAWTRTVVSLHSFSKDLAIPGYRVGAVVGSVELNRETCKLLDCVAVCAPRVGQEAAWAGLTGAGRWRAERVRELARRRGWLRAAMAERPGGFELLSCGGFFGWIAHPFEGVPTADVVRALVRDHGVLVVPGTAFLPDDRRTLRVSVGNADRSGIAELATRLRAMGSTLTTRPATTQ